MKSILYCKRFCHLILDEPRPFFLSNGLYVSISSLSVFITFISLVNMSIIMLVISVILFSYTMLKVTIFMFIKIWLSHVYQRIKNWGWVIRERERGREIERMWCHHLWALTKGSVLGEVTREGLRKLGEEGAECRAR